jgi:PKD repeat protein
MYPRRLRADERVAGPASSRATSKRGGAKLLLLLAAAMLIVASMASSAGAKVFVDKVTGQRYGIVPTVNAKPAPSGTACLADNTDCTVLSYHGGPVQHAEKDYMLFWTPAGHALPSAYKLGLNNWLNENVAIDYTAGNLFAIDQEFYDTSGPSGAHRFVPYGITNGGMLTDTDAYPASGCSDDSMPICLTDAQIQAEISKYVTAHALPKGAGTEYFLFTPNGVGSCFDSTSTQCAYTGYCGYHGFIGTGGSSTEILYANMPWAYNINGCDVNLAFGAGYANADAIDPVVGIWSHEASETMTDPNLNAWYQTSGTDAGFEDGDKCAYIYGSGGYGSTTGLHNNGLGFWNYQFGTDQYLEQLEWDQRLKTCERVQTDTQPTLAVSPTTATHGVSRTFTATVTDPAGISTIQWTFGDGVVATTTTTSIAHTYATAGAKTMTVIVTDNHGNTRRVIQTVTVS